jgi:pilus assembly protein CpaB
MKARGLILLGVSALLGFAAVAWVKKPVGAVGMSSVVVAKVALNFGDQLTAPKMAIVEMPPASVPQGAFAKIEELAAENHVVLRSMAPGEPVLATKISGMGGRAILSTLIDPTMRAAAIRVNDVNGVAGFVQPGDRVDVLLTRSKTGNDREQTDTTLLLQNVKVLGIDQQADDKTDKPTVAKTLTLEVSPDDAQKLTLASSIGNLSVSLRNYADPAPVAARRLTIGDLVPTTPNSAPAEVEAPAVKRTIEILRGTNGTTYDVTRSGNVLPAEKSAMPPRAVKPKPVRTQVAAQRAENEY